MADIFAAIVNAAPVILSAGFVLLFLIGFWRGLSIKPRPSHERIPDVAVRPNNPAGL